MSKELFRDASKCKNKKQEVRRKNKSEQKKLEGKSLDIRDGGLIYIPPYWEGGGGETIALPPLPTPKKISGIGVLLSQM